MTQTIYTSQKPSKSIKMIDCQVHGHQMICGCFLNYVEHLEAKLKKLQSKKVKRGNKK